jgi:hypothetical protein
MKNSILKLAVLLLSMASIPSFAQADKEPTALGLPGDNLNLSAVLALFQKSETIEGFEKSLNSEKEGINNLDLDNDKKTDFIKVTTKKEKDSYTFVLQDPISKTETQDVAVILVSKEKDGKYSVQIVGDKELYGKDYIVEPVAPKETAATANPAYAGEKTAPATTVTVAASPVIVYLYSPVYVPYVPVYYYGFYPPYFHPWIPIAYSVYWHNHYHYHSHYHNTVVIHNSNHYNHYSSTYRHTSTTVVHHNQNGSYKGTYQGHNYAKPASPHVNSTAKPAASHQPSQGTRTNQQPADRQQNHSTNAASRQGSGMGGRRRR